MSSQELTTAKFAWKKKITDYKKAIFVLRLKVIQEGKINCNILCNILGVNIIYITIIM